MVRIINIIALLIFFSFGSFLAVKLLINKFIFLGLLTAFIIIISAIIFLRPKAYAFRFMYPGFLTFLLFMVLPILFTIYIGFTNLSTGHFLSQRQVHKILSEEVFFPADETIYNYQITPTPDANIFQIFVKREKDNKTFLARVDLKSNNKKVKLIPSILKLEAINALSPGEVFQMRHQLKQISFILPNEKELKYYRTKYLANLQKRYKSLEDGKLKDRISSDIYYPDMKKGFYSNEKEDIAPGFYVNIGFDNFTSLITSKKLKDSFIKIMSWTLIWAMGTVFLTFAVGMFLSLILNDKALKLKAIYRMLLVIPYSIPFFISVLIFQGMLNKDFGIINEFIALFGITKINWLGHPIWAKASCLLVNLWLGFPYMFLITTGILQSIPPSVYEAAALDGAGRWATFRKITLPMIMSAVGPLLVGSFAFNLNNFVGIYLLTGGGPPIVGASTPAGETDILISYTYRLAFEGGQGQNFGLASSIAMFIFIIISILTIINFRLSGMMKEQKV